jgi:hypothetical protein
MHETVKEDKADVVVVGAGVIGLSIAAKCVSGGLRVLVLEGNSDIGKGISARGSNVIHSGIYYPENSLKKQFCVSGQSLLYDYCRRRNIGHRICGKLVVATAPEQIKKLEAIATQAERNEIPSVRWMDSLEIRQIEPALDVSAGLFVSNTGIIDGPAYLTSLREEIEESRGTILLDHKVSNVQRQKRGFIVEAKTKSGTKYVKCTKVVLAGGLPIFAIPLINDRFGISCTQCPLKVDWESTLPWACRVRSALGPMSNGWGSATKARLISQSTLQEAGNFTRRYANIGRRYRTGRSFRTMLECDLNFSIQAAISPTFSSRRRRTTIWKGSSRFSASKALG